MSDKPLINAAFHNAGKGQALQSENLETLIIPLGVATAIDNG